MIEGRSDKFDFDNGELLCGASYWDVNKYSFSTRDHSSEEITRDQAPELIAKITAWLESEPA